MLRKFVELGMWGSGNDPYINKLLSVSPSSLWGYWPLNDGGLIARDHSPNSRDMAYNGNIVLRQPGPSAKAKSTLFDGSTTYAELALTAGSENLERGPDLVVNGGFESYTGSQDDGNADTFTGWTATNSGGSHCEATATVHAGTNALKLTQTSANASMAQTITVTPGNYILSFWTTGDGTNPGRYNVYDVTHASYLRATISTGRTADSPYTLYQYNIAVPAGCTQITINLFTSGVASSYCRFDDISFRRLYNLSFLVWVKRGGDINTVRQYVMDRFTSTDNRLWAINFVGTGESLDSDVGKVRGIFSTVGDNTSQTIFSTTVLAVGTWYPILLTYKLSGITGDTHVTVTLYINGISEASASLAASPIFNGVSPLRLGATNVVGGYHFFLGNEAHCAIWSSLLTDADALTLATI